MEYVPQWVMELGQYVPSIPADSLVPLLVFAGIGIFIFRGGIRTGVALFVATYAAVLLYLFFPYFDNFQRLIQEATADAPLVHALLFAALTIGAYIVLRRPVTADVPWFGFRRFVLSALLGAIETGLLIALAHHLIPITDLLAAPAGFEKYFVPEAALFWWLATPLIAIFVLTRRTL